MNYSLSEFLSIAVLRNGGLFAVIEIESNGYNNVTAIKGTIKVDGVDINTRWNTDGSNRTNGFEYDLVKITPIQDFNS